MINSKNLEPGIFPDANGKIEGEDQEEDITLSDLFYEQTVEHLKEKGLKPSEEIEVSRFLIKDISMTISLDRSDQGIWLEHTLQSWVGKFLSWSKDAIRPSKF